MAISKYKGTATFALVTLCVIGLVACSSNSSSTKAAKSSAAAPAQTANATSSTNLPIYSGATKQAMPPGFNPTASSCGRKIAVVSSYKVDADAQTVANWYESRLPGGSVINIVGDSGSNAAHDTSIQILDANGDAGVIITQMRFTSTKLANAAKSIGADKTGIGFETYDPPLSADYIALIKQATGSDAAAKQAAKDKLKQMCGSNSSN